MADDPNGKPKREDGSGPEVVGCALRDEEQVNIDVVHARFEGLVRRRGDLNPEEQVVGVRSVFVDAEQK